MCAACISVDPIDNEPIQSNQSQRKSVETTEFKLRGDFVALCDLLKLAGIADSGGRGKAMVTEGLVKVDGVLETRKTAKIRAGQTVTCGEHSIQIVS